MQAYIKRLINKENLSIEEAASAMACIMRGQATEAQIGSFITALSMKGETVDEITGCAQMMRQLGEHIVVDENAIDIVGTGGDGGRTFNISTLASLVVASCGVKVAKHGNRGVTSQCGSADLMEGLGMRLDLTPAQTQHIFEQTGICFMFAPVYHGSLRYAAKPRKELGVKSIFNLLGPLTNPARASYMLFGVYDQKWAEPLAQVLHQLGVKRAMVVHGKDGLDEVSLTAPTSVCEMNRGVLTHYEIEPGQFGLGPCEMGALAGGDVAMHIQIAKDIISGKEQGYKQAAVILNAACGLYVAEKAQTIEEGIVLAKAAIHSGKTLELVEQLVGQTQQIGVDYVS
ncbi:MAG: anthranilate phosphoribosyltransferase [Cellulosilyticaceae bacterium]